jgi:hypothetical protein
MICILLLALAGERDDAERIVVGKNNTVGKLAKWRSWFILVLAIGRLW